MSEEQTELASIDTIDMEENDDVDGEFIPTQVQDDKMIKRNSVDNYKSDSAGVRETLANGVAAIMEAEDEDVLEIGNGELIVRLEREDGNWKLTIRDNGIGMTRERLNVLSNMGDSTSGVHEKRIGKYGIGFYAIFCLVELSGGIILATKSRKTDESYLCRWRLNGGKILSDEHVPQFEEDEYGTHIELYLKDDLSEQEVDEWIREHAFAARRKVVYEKEDRTGELTSTTYPNVDIVSEYASSAGDFAIESEWFSAITSPEAEEKRLLLDISVSSEYDFNFPWSVAVRFDTEENTIVATENHSVLDDTVPDDTIIGKNVLPSDQYDMVPDDLKEGYIPKRELSDNDVYTPASAGTRDSLSDVTQFMSWLETEFRNRFQSTVDPILEKDIPDGCTEEELIFLYEIIGDCKSSRSVRRVMDDLTTKNLWKSSITDSLGDLVEFNIRVEDSTFRNLTEELNTSYNYGSQKFSAMGLHEFAQENNAEIYMGVNINEDKAAVARDLNENAIFVKLTESDEYDLYEPLSWSKIKNITKSSLVDLDISEDQKENYEDMLSRKTSDSDSTPITEEKISVRFGIGRRGNLHTISISEMRDKLKQGNKIGRYSPDRVVLFPDSESENVSNYYDLGDSQTCVAKCSEQALQYLDEFSEVYTYNEYLAEALDTHVTTNHGYISGEDILEGDFNHIVATLLSAQAYSMLDQEYYDTKTIKKAHSHSNSIVGRYLNDKSNHELLHLTLTQKTERKIRPVLQGMSGNKSIIYGDVVSGSLHSPDWNDESKISTGVDTAKWVALMKIAPLNGQNVDTVMDFISRSSLNFHCGGEEAINALVRGLDTTN